MFGAANEPTTGAITPGFAAPTAAPARSLSRPGKEEPTAPVTEATQNALGASW